MFDIKINLEPPSYLDKVEDLFTTIFGPGRFSKMVFLLREHCKPNYQFSHIITGSSNQGEDQLIGALRIYDMQIGDTNILLFGPIAIQQQYQAKGLGKRLIETVLDKIKQSNSAAAAILLVGNIDYYSKFGFQQFDNSAIEMPAPFDRKRLLILELKSEAASGLKGQAKARCHHG